VAAKNVPVGTPITRDNLDTIMTKQRVPKSSVRDEVVLNPDDLINKRVVRNVFQGEMFKTVDVQTVRTLYIPNKHNISIPMTAARAAGGRVGPGSTVDLRAGFTAHGKNEVLTVLVNVHVLEVDGKAELPQGDRLLNMKMVTLALTDDEITLLDLANRLHSELVLIDLNPDRGAATSYDAGAVRKKLEDALRTHTDVTRREEKKGDEKAVPVTVKVLVAHKTLVAGTEITPAVLDTMFDAREMAADKAPGACRDHAALLGKSLERPVLKGHYLTEEMIGGAASGGGGETRETPKQLRYLKVYGAITGTVYYCYEVLPSGEEIAVEVLTQAQYAERIRGK
jgi:Flp pilus assembly protein CpaB